MFQHGEDVNLAAKQDSNSANIDFRTDKQGASVKVDTNYAGQAISGTLVEKDKKWLVETNLYDKLIEIPINAIVDSLNKNANTDYKDSDISLKKAMEPLFESGNQKQITDGQLTRIFKSIPKKAFKKEKALITLTLTKTELTSIAKTLAAVAKENNVGDSATRQYLIDQAKHFNDKITIIQRKDGDTLRRDIVVGYQSLALNTKTTNNSVDLELMQDDNKIQATSKTVKEGFNEYINAETTEGDGFTLDITTTKKSKTKEILHGEFTNRTSTGVGMSQTVSIDGSVERKKKEILYNVNMNDADLSITHSYDTKLQNIDSKKETQIITDFESEESQTIISQVMIRLFSGLAPMNANNQHEYDTF